MIMFPLQNGYVNMPQYYVICTLPILYSGWTCLVAFDSIRDIRMDVIGNKDITHAPVDSAL